MMRLNMTGKSNAIMKSSLKDPVKEDNICQTIKIIHPTSFFTGRSKETSGWRLSIREKPSGLPKKEWLNCSAVQRIIFPCT